MSEYVEARYAKLVLREARLAEDDVASKLINELLRDLKSFQGLNSARVQAVTSIRQLSLSLVATGFPQAGPEPSPSTRCFYSRSLSSGFSCKTALGSEL